MERKEIKMYTVYDSNGIPYETVWNEIEADYIAYYIGGYYEENRRMGKLQSMILLILAVLLMV